MSVPTPFIYLLCVGIFSFFSSLFLISQIEIQDSSNDFLLNSSSICSNIKQVATDGDVINIKFNENYYPNEKTKEVFALQTNALNNEKIKVFFPLNTSSFVYKTTTRIAIRFYLPFVQNYNAELLCSDYFFNEKENYNNTKYEKMINNYKEFKPLIQRKDRIRLNASILKGDDSYSRFHCHGKDWRDRWCEGTNIAIIDRHFYFKSLAKFHFPDIFIIPGARGYPFDKAHTRLYFEPYVVEEFFPLKSFNEINDITYVYDSFWNYHMIWHIMMDLVLPLRRFIKLVNDTRKPTERRLVLMSDGVWIFDEILKIFSAKYVPIINKERTSYLLKECYIGIDKLEDGLFRKRKYKDSINFKYNFNNETDPHLRNDTLQAMRIPTDLYGTRENKKLVLVIDRESTARVFLNVNEVVDYMKKSCKVCDVKIVHFERLSVHEQVELTSKASVLMGVHGCGLTHVFWMHPSSKNFSTHMIEILPYKYNCRDWYHTAANVANVEYHSVMNKNPPETKLISKIPNSYQCIHNSWSTCESTYCHEALKDQNVKLEIDTFQETWIPIVNALENE